jgi:hypothetical protein
MEGASVTAKHIFSNDHASRMVRDSGGQDAQKCPIQRIRRQKGSENGPRSYKSVRKCPFHPILDLAINLGEKKIFRLKPNVTLHDFPIFKRDHSSSVAVATFCYLKMQQLFISQDNR